MSEFERFRLSPGDSDALTAWYRDVYPCLFFRAFRMTRGNRPLAEDLCQDAILSFVTSGAVLKVSDRSKVLAYLQSSLANRYIDLLRRSERESREGVGSTASSEGSAYDQVSASQQLRLLIDQLDPESQELLALVYAGEPLGRIAAILDISYSNAGVRVHRLRKQIKDICGDGHEL